MKTIIEITNQSHAVIQARASENSAHQWVVASIYVADSFAQAQIELSKEELTSLIKTLQNIEASL